MAALRLLGNCGTPERDFHFSGMRVLWETFSVFGQGGFLIAIAILALFEAGFAAVTLALTSSGG